MLEPVYKYEQAATQFYSQ